MGNAAVQDATQTAPGAEEVGRAKQESLNSFVFNFSSSTAQLQVGPCCFVMGVLPAALYLRFPLGCCTHLSVQSQAHTPVHPACCPSPLPLLQRLVSYSLQGIPRDYLFQYQRGIEAVTPDQVLAAALRRLHPARQTVVVAGDASRVRPELERLGWQIEPLQIEGAGVKM